MYATWEYYRDIWSGTVIDRIEYKRLARKASAFLDSVTFYNIDDTWAADDRVRDACCAVIDTLQEYADCFEKRGINSETIGSESVSYASDRDSRTALRTDMTEAARQYLGDTGLLYRGVS